MRSSSRSIGFAALLSVFVVLPVSAAFAESADVENSTADGDQFDPAGPDSYVPKPGNLNSVPEDGASLRSLPGTDSPLVKQILAARPNEDLVICIAGCYAGRNRVVYAQPSSSALRGSLSSTMIPADPQKSGNVAGARRAAAIDPTSLAIINGTN
ncbi:hypothetical protein RLW55_20570 [Hyphomicrobium sp. B1]|uniref:hypothetical protein n=1 Tax=Hyphomicrobium sp. B1 TaxID=3075651 RepID=UPI003C2AEFA7